MKRLAALALIALPTASSAVLPHHSFDQLTTGNGFGFAVYDAAAGKLTTFTEHPYASAAPGVDTRNLAFDSYFGLRGAGQAGWLAGEPVAAAGYLADSHVARAVQAQGPLTAETHVFAPWGVAAPAVVLALHVMNSSRAPVTDAAAYALLNFHLGAGAPAPAPQGERIDWDASTQSYSESGPSGLTLRYLPFQAASAGAAVHSASPNDPYRAGAEGGELVSTDSSGQIDDAVAGFQWTLGALQPGDDRWVAVLVTLGSAQDGRSFLAGRDPAAVLQAKLAAWEAWRVAPPANLSEAETSAWRQSESVLRMAQVREAAPAAGQIVAALPPGQWWISWVRDQAYAIAALARMGHAAEAKAAVDFWVHGRVGQYKRYVGSDYAVSVVRYYGDGEEWSDSNDHGPNIEFDGFGLAAWAAHEAGRSEMDANSGPLVSLIEPKTGLLAADSSIWEVHWQGKQKHFAYTDITAAAGLCAAGDAPHAKSIRDALLKQMGLPAGGLAGNLEELQAQAPALDAATVEAINLGLVDPLSPIGRSTLLNLEKLRARSGRGYMRNDDGGGYDSQEWVFIDLRASSALRRAKGAAAADELLAWVTLQAKANNGLMAELYDADAADYAGAIPMVGFGAGAYVLALLDRATPEAQPACFVQAAPPASGGCSSAGGSLWAALGAVALLWRRRR